MNTDAITIDGFGPLPVARPSSVAELCDLVRRCAAEGQAVYPVGGGTMLDYGLPPAKPGLAIDTRSLDQVIDYPARDMTITVQAGITVARLREVTRAEGLDLPIDVPAPDRATLGGAIACNVSGPRRYGYGTFRDYVLGITTVNDRGEAVSAGGRVVKNVAGYDLMKLHTGALGTLGVIAQVTLKLRPMPEARAICSLRGQLDDLAAALDRLHASATRPVVIDVAGTHDPAGDEWVVTVGYDGGRAAVEWQVEQLHREMAGQSFRAERAAPDGTWPPADVRTGSVVIRVGIQPSDVAGVCRAAARQPGLRVRGQAGTGVLRIASDPPTWEAARAIVLSLLEATPAECRSSVTIERCPTEWKTWLPIWGKEPSAMALMIAVKRALDPNHLFNPGRFVTDV